jgi:hypothetical protein
VINPKGRSSCGADEPAISDKHSQAWTRNDHQPFWDTPVVHSRRPTPHWVPSGVWLELKVA